jgi:hypothetical protein
VRDIFVRLVPAPSGRGQFSSLSAFLSSASVPQCSYSARAQIFSRGARTTSRVTSSIFPKRSKRSEPCFLSESRMSNTPSTKKASSGGPAPSGRGQFSSLSAFLSSASVPQCSYSARATSRVTSSIFPKRSKRSEPCFLSESRMSNTPSTRKDMNAKGPKRGRGWASSGGPAPSGRGQFSSLSAFLRRGGGRA